jgi:hypothetical protein
MDYFWLGWTSFWTGYCLVMGITILRRRGPVAIALMNFGCAALNAWLFSYWFGVAMH